jgi:hypothetical protein
VRTDPLERLLLHGQAAFELTDRFEQLPVDQHRFAVLRVEPERPNQAAFVAHPIPLTEEQDRAERHLRIRAASGVDAQLRTFKQRTVWERPA